MTKEQFKAKTVLAKDFLNEHFKGEEGIAFALLLEAKDVEEQLIYNDLITNIAASGAVKFIMDIVKKAAGIIGRQN